MVLFDEKTISVLLENLPAGIVRHRRQNREIMARSRQPSGEIGESVLRSSRLWWIVLSQNQNMHDEFPGRAYCARNSGQSVITSIILRAAFPLP